MANKRFKWLGITGFVLGGLFMNLAVGVAYSGLNVYAGTFLYWFGLMCFLFSCFSFKKFGSSEAGGFE